ncbi:DUF6907 domain-containing protein [Streptomyces tremellae]|uniref:DUF222 domain-containing protein n=1 Tax=Streptomyces tremellae TaxID=1124239 RepID=A0ABP7EY47_9ACTN
MTILPETADTACLGPEGLHAIATDIIGTTFATPDQAAALHQIAELLAATDDPAAAVEQVLQQTRRCRAYGWCTVTGPHELHRSGTIEYPTPEAPGASILDGTLMHEDGDPQPPMVGFLDADLTPAETRRRCAEIRAHVAQVELLADLIDPDAVEPAAETAAVTAPGARGTLRAELYTSDHEDPAERWTKVTLWADASLDAEMTLDEVDLYLADLDQFAVRVRSLRQALAAELTAPAQTEPAAHPAGAPWCTDHVAEGDNGEPVHQGTPFAVPAPADARPGLAELVAGQLVHDEAFATPTVFLRLGDGDEIGITRRAEARLLADRFQDFARQLRSTTAFLADGTQA